MGIGRSSIFLTFMVGTLSVCRSTASAAEQSKHLGRGFSDVQRDVQMFESPARAQWQKPDEVVKALHLKPGQNVADIGAGTGYFTRRLAKAVAPKGMVYAVDIEPHLLDYIVTRAAKDGQKNIVTVLGFADDPNLKPHSVDLIFICDTIHHIGQRGAYYAKLIRALRPGGRLAIVDYQKKQTPGGGPPLEERIAKTDLVKEVEQAGFKLTQDLNFLPRQYFLVFAVPAPKR